MKTKNSSCFLTLNTKDDGYRGIWYYNEKSQDEYVYKYSGGLGTYCAKHKSFAIYCDKAKKTFFCYGGTTKHNYQKLLHMVSYYDHRTCMVPRPTIILNKKTNDAHDNPVISIDDKGYIWIFSTSHGLERPSYIHKSKKPYNINEFKLIKATKKENHRKVPMTNFSYMQVWHMQKKGFLCFFTRYHYPAIRTSCYMVSPDGINWSKWTRLAAIDEGHYQISAITKKKAGTAFNFHPKGKGLNWRTNLYYIETDDFGRTWKTINGKKLMLPITDIKNPSLVHDYQSEGLNVYLKDIRYDKEGNPIILYLTSKGYQSGPINNPRTWTIAHWTDKKWNIRPAMTSDSNYDTGSLYIEKNGIWRIIAPTQTGPQPFNPGGEITMWLSKNQGKTWKMTKQMTRNSKRNHNYVRHPVNVHPDFYAMWADGHGRKPSESYIYFSNKEGKVYRLPQVMTENFAKPVALKL